MTGPLPIGADAPDFEAATTKARFASTSGSATRGAFCSRIPRTSRRSARPSSATWPGIKPEFDKRNVKVIGLSVDPLDRHEGWSKDIEETQGHAPNYPMIADSDLKVAKLYGMLPADGRRDRAKGARPPTTPRSATSTSSAPTRRSSCVISYPMSTGRNFDEVLRVIDSMQLTAKHKVATPANWKDGDDVIILPAVSDDEAQKTYPEGWKAPKPYLRIVPQPRG